mgnify:CR=1 FL=1|tara:strand:- start:2067 stop:2279 length:213 start_codon:yes stop_codon:yes gene_type:complete
MLLNRSDLLTVIDEIVNQQYYAGRSATFNVNVNKLESLLPSQLHNIIKASTRDGRINKIVLIKQVKKIIS